MVERLKPAYTMQFMQMVPPELQECAKRLLCLQFDEEPPYDYFIECLQQSFEKQLKDKRPNGPPSNSMRVVNEPQKNYVFEWNRTLASRVRNEIIYEAVEFERAVEISIQKQMSESVADQASVKSKDISFRNLKSARMEQPASNSQGLLGGNNEKVNSPVMQRLRQQMRERSSGNVLAGNAQYMGQRKAGKKGLPRQLSQFSRSGSSGLDDEVEEDSNGVSHYQQKQPQIIRLRPEDSLG